MKKVKHRSSSVVPNGAAVRKAREARGLSRAKLAQDCRVSENTLGLIENSKSASAEKVVTVANFLNLDYEELIGPRPRGILVLRLQGIELEVSENSGLVEVLKHLDLAELLKEFMKIIGATEKPIIKKIEQGSILLTLEMPVDDIERARRAFIDGKLKNLNVASIEPVIATFSTENEPGRKPDVNYVDPQHAEIILSVRFQRFASTLQSVLESTLEDERTTRIRNLAREISDLGGIDLSMAISLLTIGADVLSGRKFVILSSRETKPKLTVEQTVPHEGSKREIAKGSSRKTTHN